jgi:hypothetical protein
MSFAQGISPIPHAIFPLACLPIGRCGRFLRMAEGGFRGMSFAQDNPSHSALTLRTPLWCRSRRAYLRSSTLSSPLCGRPCVWPKGDLGGCRSRRTTPRTPLSHSALPCGVGRAGQPLALRSHTPLSLVVSVAQDNPSHSALTLRTFLNPLFSPFTNSIPPGN